MLVARADLRPDRRLHRRRSEPAALMRRNAHARGDTEDDEEQRSGAQHRGMRMQESAHGKRADFAQAMRELVRFGSTAGCQDQRSIRPCPLLGVLGVLGVLALISGTGPPRNLGSKKMNAKVPRTPRTPRPDGRSIGMALCTRGRRAERVWANHRDTEVTESGSEIRFGSDGLCRIRIGWPWPDPTLISVASVSLWFASSCLPLVFLAVLVPLAVRAPADQ